MFTMRRLPRDMKHMALWLVALVSVAMTAAVYRWLPNWVPTMRAVSWAGSAIALVWLWTPAWKRWLARHRTRTP